MRSNVNEASLRPRDSEDADNGRGDNPASPEEIDTSVATAVRVYDYLLGGSASFAVDREAAEHAWGSRSGGVDRGRAEVRANRAFLAEAVRYLARAGIRQFIDIGTFVPTPESVWDVAQQAASSSRVVSVSHDLVVLAHAHQLRGRTPEGGVADYVHGDLRDPAKIMQRAAATLDLSTEPVALVLVGVLCLLSDDDDPHKVVAGYLDAVPPGSYLVMSHFASDLDADEVAGISARLNKAMQESFVPRTRGEVSRFLDGLDVLGPGVVPLNDWQLPGTEPLRVGDQTVRYYCGVGRKPGNRHHSASSSPGTESVRGANRTKEQL